MRRSNTPRTSHAPIEIRRFADDGESPEDTITQMRLKTTHTALESFYDEDLMGDEYDPPGISFSQPKEDGTRTSQQVKKDVGERIASELDGFEPLDSNDGADDSDDDGEQE